MKKAREVTVCTANMHNMFVLYKTGFKAPGQFCYEEIPGGFRYLPAAVDGNRLLAHPESRKLAATALRRGLEALPEVLIMQEVESPAALDFFNEHYLAGAYPYTILVGSHYERLLNVGVMSTFPIICVRSHKDERTEDGEYLFSRDCLEITVDIKGRPLTIFANHFKSRLGKTAEEKDAADARRQRQGERVAEIVKERFGGMLEAAAFVVAGDLNDTPDSATLSPLLELGMEDVFSRLPEDERWSHYWVCRNTVSHFDYILLSPALSENSPGVPCIERRGLPVNGKKTAPFGGCRDLAVPIDFRRFPGVDEKIFASDHAFVFFTLTLPR